MQIQHAKKYVHLNISLLHKNIGKHSYFFDRAGAMYPSAVQMFWITARYRFYKYFIPFVCQLTRKRKTQITVRITPGSLFKEYKCLTVQNFGVGIKFKRMRVRSSYLTVIKTPHGQPSKICREVRTFQTS